MKKYYMLAGLGGLFMSLLILGVLLLQPSAPTAAAHGGSSLALQGSIASGSVQDANTNQLTAFVCSVNGNVVTAMKINSQAEVTQFRRCTSTDLTLQVNQGTNVISYGQQSNLESLTQGQYIHVTLQPGTSVATNIAIFFAAQSRSKW